MKTKRTERAVQNTLNESRDTAKTLTKAGDNSKVHPTRNNHNVDNGEDDEDEDEDEDEEENEDANQAYSEQFAKDQQKHWDYVYSEERDNDDELPYRGGWITKSQKTKGAAPKPKPVAAPDNQPKPKQPVKAPDNQPKPKA